MTEPVMRRIPPDLKGMDDAEVDHAMDVHFDIRLIQPDLYVQRILWTLIEERSRVGQLRHWLAHAGHNMARPQTEAAVLNSAVAIALSALHREDAETACSILEIVTNEVALSMAGKLDLDVAAWADRDTDEVSKVRVNGVSVADLHQQATRIDSLEGTISRQDLLIASLKDQLEYANKMLGQYQTGEKP